MTVFPQPKAPGMAQVPPRTEGKRASRTRCTKQKSLGMKIIKIITSWIRQLITTEFT